MPGINQGSSAVQAAASTAPISGVVMATMQALHAWITHAGAVQRQRRRASQPQALRQKPGQRARCS